MARCARLPPPGSLSLPSMSWELYLTSIIVPSHHIQLSGCASQLNPGPFSTPSRSRRFVSPLHPGSQIHVSSLSQLNLTSIRVLIFTSHLHPGYISPPSRSTKLHLSSIQASSQTNTVSRCVSHLHPCPSSTGSRSQDSVLTTSMHCLTSIQVHRFPSHLHPGRVSPPCRCWYLRLTDSRRLE